MPGLSHLWQPTRALETQGCLEKQVGGVELEQIVYEHSTPDLVKVQYGNVTSPR